VIPDNNNIYFFYVRIVVIASGTRRCTEVM
jgi:hypothetical protein